MHRSYFHLSYKPLHQAISMNRPHCSTTTHLDPPTHFNMELHTTAAIHTYTSMSVTIILILHVVVTLTKLTCVSLPSTRCLLNYVPFHLIINYLPTPGSSSPNNTEFYIITIQFKYIYSVITYLQQEFLRKLSTK